MDDITLLFNSFPFRRICAGSCKREKSSMEMRYFIERENLLSANKILFINGKLFVGGAKSETFTSPPQTPYPMVHIKHFWRAKGLPCTVKILTKKI